MDAPNYLFYGLIGILVILFITSLIKKAFKLMTLVIMIIIGISLYNIVIKGVSPIDEVNSYKTDISYTKNIKDYSEKIKTSVGNIKKAAGNPTKQENVDIISLESENLHKYEEEVLSLKHSSKLKLFHEKYCNYLTSLVKTSDSALKLTKLGGSSSQNVSSVIDKLMDNFNSLAELK
ncbi:hypothetical protein CLHOM_01890 [Clostridium homopropionicum DSM 5847]|uniref:Uncharacterized protein n=1 Tax=Clostridium homopropionicum DSM 5847 TaxID=1121318 RepID=A0A0L6ZFD7_9CLOT|nr:hypothetical protein [Clostridium homopropionicum]KOA21518.1 hypothetical protein CLHOM_01890 [Clostridium homopropionicum DSM 5847]SFG07081.1 hypothetical protein SAMN04488501_10532 [Clostridium homopropionicum]